MSTPALHPPHAPHGASDADLVQIARGDTAASGAESARAFAVLVERHQPRIHALLRRRIGPADAEDLAQEAFLRAWQSLDRFDAARCFRTWIHTIASRLAVDHLRSRSAAVKRDRRAGRERAGAHASPALPDRAASDKVWRTAREVLTDAAFTALWLRYVEGLQAKQIARVLGKNRVAVSMMLCRARETLADHLGGTDAAGLPARPPRPAAAPPPEPTTVPPALAQGVLP